MPEVGQDTLLIADVFDLSEFAFQSDLSFEVAMHEATTYANTWRRYKPGLFGGTMSFGGFAEFDLDDQVFRDFSGGENLWVTHARVRTLGSTAFVLRPLYGSVSFTEPVDGLIECVGSLTASGKDTAVARMLTPGKTDITGDGSSAVTSNGGGVDNEAATTDGGYVLIHILDWQVQQGTSPSVEITLQHRTAMNVAWADHSSLADSDAPDEAGSYRLALAGTINRHARLVLEFEAGIRAATVVAAIARL